jgi:hypothetical protein
VPPSLFEAHSIRVGGTKNPRVDDIRALTPDLVHTAAPVSKVQTLLQAERGPHVPLHSCPHAVSAMRRPVTVQFVPPRPPPLPDVDLNIRFVRFAL